MRILDRRRVEQYCGPTTIYHIVSEILPWVLFLGTVVALAAGWSKIPDMVPMNTDFQGNVTDWGGKRNLIWLCAVDFGMILLLWIVGYFPRSWHHGLRIRSLGRTLRVGDSGVNYRLTRDLLCDLRISVSVLFSALLLITAFYHPVPAKHMFSWGIWVLIGVPLLRYLLRHIFK